MNRKNLYLLDPSIKWPAFKKLHDKFVRDSGPTPKNVDKILWQMLRKRKIMCGFSDSMPGDMWLGRKIPKKGWKVKGIIGNPKP